VAKAQREIQYTDYISPRFQLTNALIYPYGTTFDVLTSVGVTDMLEGDISHRIRTTPLDNESVANVGIHNVEFRVTNSFGETVRLVLPVEVYPAGNYPARLNLTDYLIYVKKGSDFHARDYLKELVVDRESVSLENGVPSTCSLNTSGAVDTSTPGTYSVAYKMTYSSAGRSVTGY
jgi:hypothetical protein